MNILISTSAPSVRSRTASCTKDCLKTIRCLEDAGCSAEAVSEGISCFFQVYFTLLCNIFINIYQLISDGDGCPPKPELPVLEHSGVSIAPSAVSVTSGRAGGVSGSPPLVLSQASTASGGGLLGASCCGAEWNGRR